MIVTSHASFRERFAERADHDGPSVTWVAADSTAETAVGNWIDYGVKVGMWLDVVGTANPGRWLVTARTNDIITLEPPQFGDPIVDGADVPIIVGYFRDPDGVPSWPLAKVRAGGFTGTLQGTDGEFRGTTSFPFRFTVDGENSGPEEHDIYLSQRTDEQPRQLIELRSVLDRTGTWDLVLTSLAVSELGILTPESTLNSDQLTRLLNYCAVYIKRQSDGAIQWVDLYKAMIG